MTHTASTTLLLAYTLFVTSVGLAQSTDVFEINGQYYLRTDMVAPELDYDLCVGYGGERVAWVGSDGFPGSYDPTYCLLRQETTWFESLHEPLLVNDDVLGRSVLETHLACASDLTVVAWLQVPREGTWTVQCRVIAPDGVPLTSSLLVAESLFGQQTRDDIRVAIGSALFAVGMMEQRSWKGRSFQYDILLRRFALNGEPLEETLPIATSELNTEEDVRVQVLPDDTIVVGYLAGPRYPGLLYPTIRRVNPDGSMDDPVTLVDEACDRFHVEVLGDGTLLCAFRLADWTGSFVQRFDAFGQPLDEPVAIDSWMRYFNCAPDGRFVIGGPQPDYHCIRIYDASGIPVTDPFLFTPGGVEARFNHHMQPLAYAPDGTIWVSWFDWEPGGHPHLTSLKPFEPGDMNFDGLVNNFDIDPFVLALTDPEAYQQLYPELPYQFLGDLNFDGDFNNFDIDPFVEALTGR